MDELRKDTIRRLQRATYWYTAEYTKELENKAKEEEIIKKLQQDENSEVKCVVLTAERNANMMLDCVKECVKAVNILSNDEDEEVDDWMLAGINAMLDKVNETKKIPFDLPTAINGMLCAQYR